MKKLCLALVFTMAMGAFAGCGQENEGAQTNEDKYNNACALIESGEYEKAYTAFKELGNYKDSQKHLSRFIYFPTVGNYVLEDRSGVMTIELGAYNLPSRMLTEGIEGSENTAYTKDGVYTYDSECNLMKQAVTYNGTLLAYDYTYDNDNNLIRAEYSVEGVVSTIHSYVYDENGFLIRESYAGIDVVYYDYHHFYDEKGNQIKSECETAEGFQVYTGTYDEVGNIVKEHGALPNDEWYDIDYTYNADGQMIQEAYMDSDERSYTTVYVYDNAGNCIKEESNYSDGTKQVHTWVYDANGNVTREELISKDGTVESVEWQYILTYLTVDVPASTMDQLMGLFNFLQ
jgi:YD repeat-containing protein